jgi:hypothetical protein
VGSDWDRSSENDAQGGKRSGRNGEQRRAAEAYAWGVKRIGDSCCGVAEHKFPAASRGSASREFAAVERADDSFFVTRTEFFYTEFVAASYGKHAGNEPIFVTINFGSACEDSRTQGR